MGAGRKEGIFYVYEHLEEEEEEEEEEGGIRGCRGGGRAVKAAGTDATTEKGAKATRDEKAAHDKDFKTKWK